MTTAFLIRKAVLLVEFVLRCELNNSADYYESLKKEYCRRGKLGLASFNTTVDLLQHTFSRNSYLACTGYVTHPLNGPDHALRDYCFTKPNELLVGKHFSDEKEVK